MAYVRFMTKEGEQFVPLEMSEEEYFENINDGNHLIYQEKVGEETLTIKLPLGTWDIMEALVPKILKYVEGDIVEIGMGESSKIFADVAYEKGVRLYSCDIQMGGMFKVFDKPLFMEHICYIGKSVDFMEEYRGNPAIVFLDGEHRYESVKREVDFFLPRLLPGGVMFMHDTFPPLENQIVPDEKGFAPGDVYKMRQELERNTDIDVFTWPYSAHGMGLTMIMKHGERTDHWKKNGHAC